MRLQTGALIRSIFEGSPADEAGFTSGCVIYTVDGHLVRDILDWRWFSDGSIVTLGYGDTEGDEGVVTLEREPNEGWGFEFEGEVFDGIKTCRNACSFCFMQQLPEGMRPSLYLRDDDYRLSFLTGTFVTLTNMEPEDEARIIEQRISPLRMSLHAISPSVRRRLMGKNEARGIEACERLLQAGIAMHVQIVLVPQENDGEELKATLTWAYGKEGIIGVGVVPLGFTKHQSVFNTSYQDSSQAQAVLSLIQSFQQTALNERGTPWVFAADEFYRSAYPTTLLDYLPPAKHYGDFDMFEDGIGIIRSTLDSWQESTTLVKRLANLLATASKRIHMLIGYAQREFIIPLIEESLLKDRLIPFAVANTFFGGNVDVTGLLCGCDIIDALHTAQKRGEVIDVLVLPQVIFNDDLLTLDDMSLEDMQSRTDIPLAVVSCNPSDYLKEMIELIHRA